MLNIVVPMAGRGSRFADAGYAIPKPLIPIHGIPMTELVIRNIRPSRPHRFIFLCLEEHLRDHGLGERLVQWAPGCEVIPVAGVTEGAACTVLLAEHVINSRDALMIANCDQWVDVSIDKYLATLELELADGLIMTMKARDPKWSFIRFGPDGLPVQLVEKQVVSHEATVGIYNFRRGSEFVRGAKAMILRELRVNGEFYVAPVYNQLIAKGARLAVFNIGSDRAGMYGLGTPADLDWFLQSEASHRAVHWREAA